MSAELPSVEQVRESNKKLELALIELVKTTWNYFKENCGAGAGSASQGSQMIQNDGKIIIISAEWQYGPSSIRVQSYKINENLKGSTVLTSEAIFSTYDPERPSSYIPNHGVTPEWIEEMKETIETVTFERSG